MTEQHRYRETRSLSKGKGLAKIVPPSPALSNAEITDGLQLKAMDESFNSSGAYYSPEQQINVQSIHAYPQPASRHGTPGPSQYYNRSQMMHSQQQYSTSQYPPIQQYQGHGSPYTDSYDYPYSTPATSPPTPNRSGVVTRSGRATSTKQAAVTSTPSKRKKADRPKAAKKSPHLDGSLSEITKGSAIPVVDIEGYVNRSAEERRKEVATGKIPGKIKRPMNAFMLYRKAYQNRAKEWCSQHNHQVVSQVCGDSWPLEPDHVRVQFNEWAKLERDNHQKAHPGYKFTPSKPQKLRVAAATNKRGRYDDEESVLSDRDDPDWLGSSRGKRAKHEHDRYEPADMYRPQTMYGGYPMADQHVNRSAFHMTNAGKPLPQPYDHVNGMNGHYYQTTVVRDPTRYGVEDVLVKKTSGPGTFLHQQQQQHQQHPHHYQQYDGTGYPPLSQSQQYADTLHGLPNNHTSYSPRQPSFTQRLDPSLMPQGGGGDDGLLGLGQYPHQIDPAHGHWQGDSQHQPQHQYQQQQSQQPQYYQEQAGLGFDYIHAGDDISPLTGLFKEAQEKILKGDANNWEIIPSTAAADDSWQEATIEPSALQQGEGRGQGGQAAALLAEAASSS